MALEDLQSDFKSNMEAARRLLAADPDSPVVKHLVQTLWPFQEAVLEEMAEQAEQLDDVIDQTGDMLQAETAAVFAALIVLSGKLAEELDKKLMPSETETRGMIVKLRELNAEASELLEEITVPPSVDDDVDDSTLDADGDDDDDDDE